MGGCAVVAVGGNWIAEPSPDAIAPGRYIMQSVDVDAAPTVDIDVVTVGPDSDPDDIWYAEGALLVGLQGDVRFGFDGPWEAVPRRAERADASPTMRAAIDQRAAELGVATDRLVVTDAALLDLNGDGTVEELAIATTTESADLVEEDLDDGIVFLLVQQDGTVIDLGSEPAYEIPRPEPFGPLYGTVTRELIGFVDGNGDGTIELLTRSVYFEGGSDRMITFDGDDAATIAECGAGS